MIIILYTSTLLTLNLYSIPIIYTQSRHYLLILTLNPTYNYTQSYHFLLKILSLDIIFTKFRGYSKSYFYSYLYTQSRYYILNPDITCTQSRYYIINPAIIYSIPIIYTQSRHLEIIYSIPVIYTQSL